MGIVRWEYNYEGRDGREAFLNRSTFTTFHGNREEREGRDAIQKICGERRPAGLAVIATSLRKQCSTPSRPSRPSRPSCRRSAATALPLRVACGKLFAFGYLRCASVRSARLASFRPL
jgi:hypothetical protein